MNDHFDDSLRDALRAEAGGVTADDELLQRIRATSAYDRSPWRQRTHWFLAAAALVIVAGLSAVLLTGADDDQTLDVVDDPTTTSTGPSPDPLAEGPLPVNCRAGEDIDVAVYMQPVASVTDLAVMAQRLESDSRVTSVRYVDRHESYAQFRRLFADEPELLETVTPDILPTAYLVTLKDRSDEGDLRAELDGAAGVYQIVGVLCGATDRGAEPPEQAVALTEGGRIVVVDTATGAVLRDLGGFDDRTDPAVAGREGGPYSITGVALHPNGQDVYFETCCEPAGGAVFRVPIDGSVLIDSSRLSPVAYGYGIDISADGQWLAYVSGPTVSVMQLETGDVSYTAASGDGTHDWVQAAINADGTVLAIERALVRAPDGRVLRSDARTTSLVDGTYEETGPAVGRFVPIWVDGGRSLASAPAPGTNPRDSNVDAAGTWILEVTDDGRLVGLSERELPIPGGPYLAADW